MDEFIRLVNNPLRFRFFLFIKLPAAFLAGVRLKFVSPDRAEATVRFQYWTKNPFRSTYFACLGMAAEMSTGILAMAHLYKRRPAISMLVTRIESDFYKKAVGVTTFSCDQGDMLRQAIDKTAATGEAVELVATSIGRNDEGAEIARFKITWSFKRKA